MYINPVLLPQVTNREDFLQTVQLYDDDTFSPLNLHGCATANGQAFTGTNWKVSDGLIVTASNTQITIPAFPIGAQLSALALTVGQNLGIKAGDPITIQDNGNAGNVMNGYVLSYAAATGALVAQIGLTYQFEIRKTQPNLTPGDGYACFYDSGVSPQSPILQASLANGQITVIDMGTLQILIPESVFRTLTGGTYAASMTCSDSVNTRQLFIAKLPVLWGGVTQ